MQDNMNYATPVSQASVEDRSDFIWKCYAHVVGGILAFAALLAYMVNSGIAYSILQFVGSTGYGFPVILGAFILTSWGASHVAHTLDSRPAQYAAFAALVFVEAIIFSPMILMAMRFPGMLDSAVGVTVIGCVGLIAVAMITRKDFSFMRGMLVWGACWPWVASSLH